MAQLDAPSDWRPGGRGFDPRRGRQHSFVEIDHEIFSTVILSLPLIQEGQLSVSGERMCTLLVNRLEDWACPVNVWLGKLTALDMTPLGWLGRKTSTQTNILINKVIKEAKTWYTCLYSTLGFSENLTVKSAQVLFLLSVCSTFCDDTQLSYSRSTIHILCLKFNNAPTVMAGYGDKILELKQVTRRVSLQILHAFFSF